MHRAPNAQIMRRAYDRMLPMDVRLTNPTTPCQGSPRSNPDASPTPMSVEIAALLARITVEPGQRSGKPCIRRMRMTVSDVLGLLASGLSREEIVSEDNYPWLEIE